jgi:hypothetical protein
MTTSVTRLPDGTYDIVQRAAARQAFTPEALQAFYWRALGASTFGIVRFRRDSIRILGVGPVLLRFGPMNDGRRPIVGGIFSRQPYGAIRWLALDGEIAVEVEKFAPRLKGPFWRFEMWLHHLVGRRYLALAERSGR